MRPVAAIFAGAAGYFSMGVSVSWQVLIEHLPLLHAT